MIDKTLFCLAFISLIALGGCKASDTGSADATPTPDMTGWQMASGKPPTQAEFAALAATCQDRSKGGPLDPCLTELGLKRTP
jgi:hypothetical protein